MSLNKSLLPSNRRSLCIGILVRKKTRPTKRLSAKLISRVISSGIKPIDSSNEFSSYLQEELSHEQSMFRNESSWFYHHCRRCNNDGSYLNVNPNCSLCSGIGEDWEEGEEGQTRLKELYGKQPTMGFPPEFNQFGRRMFANSDERIVYEEQQRKAETLKKHHENIWNAFKLFDSPSTLDSEKQSLVTHALLISKAIASGC